MGAYGGCVAIADGVVVCRPRGFAYRAMRRCSSCRKVRRHLMEDEAWYGVRITCVTCGLERTSEEGTRRLSRAQRRRNADRARALWPIAGTRAEWLAWLHEDLFGDAS